MKSSIAKSLETFDTLECEQFLENITTQQLEQWIAQGAHRHSVQRVNQLRSKLSGMFQSREKIIDSLFCAAIAQVPTVLIGPPGTAKSAMVRAMCQGLGLYTPGPDNKRRYFEHMLTRFTAPEEIFGPWHIKDMVDRQIYRRVTDNYLPAVQVAFLDEVFKASSAILNTLLTLLNERLFYNGGVAEKSPLLMAFAASNELPDDELLGALVDRFPLRIICPRVPPADRARMIELSWQFSFNGAHIAPIACANDLRLLGLVSRTALGGQQAFPSNNGWYDFRLEFLNYFNRFEEYVSDRTASLLLAYARAYAMLCSDASGRDLWDQERPNQEQALIPRRALEVFRHISTDANHQRQCDRMFRQANGGGLV